MPQRDALRGNLSGRPPKAVKMSSRATPTGFAENEHKGPALRTRGGPSAVQRVSSLCSKQMRFSLPHLRHVGAARKTVSVVSVVCISKHCHRGGGAEGVCFSCAHVYAWGACMHTGHAPRNEEKLAHVHGPAHEAKMAGPCDTANHAQAGGDMHNVNGGRDMHHALGHHQQRYVQEPSPIRCGEPVREECVNLAVYFADVEKSAACHATASCTVHTL